MSRSGESDAGYDGCTDLGWCGEECNEGYEETTEPCSEGVNGCVLQDAEGGDLGYLACLCEDSCPGFAAESCEGDPDCTTVEACSETLHCTTCADAACAENEILVPSCGDDEHYTHAEGSGTAGCRSETCGSNANVSFGCKARYDCTVSCPEGMTACDTESDTCVRTPSCASTLLCQAS